MATTKKPAAPAAVKEVPAASPKPAPKSVVAKKVAPVAAAAVKTVLVKVAPKAAAKAVATPVAEKALPPVAKPAVKAAAKKKAKPVSVHLDPAQRAKHIEVAAFYIAERRGFTPGNPEQDYLEAASEIDRLIAVGHFGK